MKQSSTSLAPPSHNLSKLLDLLPTGIFAFNAARELTYANSWMQRNLGLGLGQKLSDAFAPKQRASIDLWLDRLMGGDKSVDACLLIPTALTNLEPEVVLDATVGMLDGKRVGVGMILLQTTPQLREQLADLVTPLRATLLTLETMLCPSVSAPPKQVHPIANMDAGLSRREEEILRLCLDGMSVRALAEHLGISVHTVRNHLKSLYRKNQVSSRAELVELYAGSFLAPD